MFQKSYYELVLYINKFTKRKHQKQALFVANS